jgi:hypothetical protein
MRVTTGSNFVVVGFGRINHILLALHRRWRVEFVKPSGKPGYRRLYLGPLEIEWFGGGNG